MVGKLGAMIDLARHLTRVSQRHILNADEIAAIRALPDEVRIFPPRSTVIREGEVIDRSTLLLSGFMCRAKQLPNGKRHMAELHVSGDFIDLHSYTLKRLDHDIETLNSCQLAFVPHHRLQAMFEAFPRLARIYWFHTSLDAANHRHWVTSIAQAPALERIATLFCEMALRLEIVGLTREGSFDFPLTQTDLGDCLGLTPVHVNRILKTLRGRELAVFRNGRVDILDQAGLRDLAQFDPAYLYLEPEPL
ncbi:Crp/Fnr family transcriptional regulator [Sphingomonas koreensis]|uniref:Crp/Fnr family transcriptional regulator n=1 Tax=Sphingomonas koreensis TaxID=93064 RepID=A0A430G4I3_9SPHN|nr:Crp/Fnr family transcriptional regulator [Sphingomonas koreensis]RSY86861.1 Crp/Fnr family transcriptional regulator [Sphingomonas koreensis]